MAIHNQIGAWGEAKAAHFLQAKGYEILDENWTFGKCEVDLICLYKGVMVFVEVKTRSSSAFGRPEEFVDQRKQNLMQTAAEAYLRAVDYKGEIRFDIVAILIKSDETYEIEHIEDAFWSYE